MSSPRELADEVVRLMCEQDPTVATLYGLDGAHDRLPDLTDAAEQACRAKYVDVAARAAAVDPATLSAEDATTRAVVLQQAEVRVLDIDARMTEYTVTDIFVSPSGKLLLTLPMLALTTADQARDYLSRLAAIPAYFAQAADRHRQGVAAGRVPVAHLVEAAIRHADRYLADPGNDPLAGPTPPDGVLPDFAARRDELLADVVRPAFVGYRDVLAAEILPHGRPADRPGLCWLPGGDDTYAQLVRMHTSTERTPDDLHRTGLDVIAGLRADYRELGGRVLGTTDLAEVFHRLRFDEALRWRTADELLDAARATIRRAETAAPEWFGLLPGHECQVQPVPSGDEDGAPAAYYLSPSLDGQRPGVFFANTGAATERFRHQVEAIAFHEAVPGHHFQITIAQGMTELPLLRRLADVNAYVEGWGLYAERLADEMGLYSGDLARLGMLTADSMRAGRLVVDTGLHAKGWSRAQAVAYLAEHTPMARVEIEAEVDRYIAFPGQALSYMVGRLEIQRIRAAAQARLGERFGIRGFHDVVLGNGPLPLSVLAGVVDDWAEGDAAG